MAVAYLVLPRNLLRFWRILIASWRVPGNSNRRPIICDRGHWLHSGSDDSLRIESRLYSFPAILANNRRTNPDEITSSLSARMPSCHRKIVSCVESSKRSGIGERSNPRSRAHGKFQTPHEIVAATSPRCEALINWVISSRSIN